MQQHIVDLAGTLDRKRGAVAGLAAQLRGPTVRAGGVAQHRQSERLGGGALGLLMQKERNGVQAGAFDGADLSHRRSEFAGQFERVHLSAALFHQVAHIEQHQGGQPHRQHRRGQHQLPCQMQRIHHQQHGVRLGRAGHLAAQYVNRDARVLAEGIERIDSGQIDQR